MSFPSFAAGAGHFFLDTEKGYRVPLALSPAAGSGKISGIFFGLMQSALNALGK